jgi:hypothetical protein
MSCTDHFWITTVSYSDSQAEYENSSKENVPCLELDLMCTESVYDRTTNSVKEDLSRMAGGYEDRRQIYVPSASFQLAVP